MIGGGTAPASAPPPPLATTLPVELSAADRARVDQADDPRPATQRAQYHVGVARVAAAAAIAGTGVGARPWRHGRRQPAGTAAIRLAESRALNRAPRAVRARRRPCGRPPVPSAMAAGRGAARLTRADQPAPDTVDPTGSLEAYAIRRRQRNR